MMITYLCMPGSAAVDENDRFALHHIPGYKLLRFRLDAIDHLLIHVTRHPLQMIVNLGHLRISHLPTFRAAKIEVFPRVSGVNVRVAVHIQGFHHCGDARHFPQAVEVQVGEKVVGGKLHPHTADIFGAVDQRTRLFIFQGICGGKFSRKLEVRLVCSVEVPLPGPQLCLQVDQKVEEKDLELPFRQISSLSGRLRSCKGEQIIRNLALPCM